jgi:TatA/E family protein of Tat protein translocase
MGELGPIHWLIALAFIVLLFGGRKIPEVMRGLAQGITDDFRDGMGGGRGGPHPLPVSGSIETKKPKREKRYKWSM